MLTYDTKDMLDGATYVKVDVRRQRMAVYMGGTYVNIYDGDGNETEETFSIGDNASLDDVDAAVIDRFEQQPFLLELQAEFQLHDDVIETIEQNLFGDANEWKEHEGVQARIRECFHRPSKYELQLLWLNHVIDDEYGMAVEVIDLPRPEGGAAFAYYINTGDSYSATVAYNLEEHRWHVTTWADEIEAYEDLKGIHRCAQCGAVHYDYDESVACCEGE